MDIKSVFIDIDGTLMDASGNIPESSLASIHRLIGKNIKVVINTGRILAEVKIVLKRIGLVLPVIGSNGGYITDDSCESLIVQNRIPAVALRQCLEICNKYGASACYSTSERFFADENFKPFIKKLRTSNISFIVGNLMTEPVYVSSENWETLFNQQTYVKFNAHHTDVNTLREIKQALTRVQGISYVCESAHNVEYSAHNVNKGSGLLLYLQMHDLNRKTSMAIGDGENDLSMLKAAGVGIAMGNADEQLKRQADFVTESIENDGLSFILNRFIH